MLLTTFISRLTILPRWIIIILDLSIISVSMVAGYCLRFNFEWNQILYYNFYQALIVNAATGLIAVLVTRSYAGIVRYTGIEDGKRIASSMLLSLALLCSFNLLHYYNVNKNLIPFSIIYISFPISFFLLFFYRLLVKELFFYLKASSSSRASKVNVVIFGAGSLGLSVKQIIDTARDRSLRLVALIEDDPSKAGKKIQGCRIYHSSELLKLVRDFQVTELIVAVNNLSIERKNKLIEECFQLHVKVRIVPPAEKWMKGELSLTQIKEVNIEDLLGRDVIKLDDDGVVEEIHGKVVLITGAAGSIGSELSRQIIQQQPKRLILLDQAETPLFEIEYELKRLRLAVDLIVTVCDIRNQGRVEKILMDDCPEIVFHAAAYKHVPLMEANPTEAVSCNIFGTRNLADLATKHRVKKFVMISTDKAVRPTSIMGCSKRIAEIYVQSLMDSRANSHSTSFVTTRFGNVLGSNGSVIPVFRKQIESGGPVTVTHPDIVRYFMTIPEACRLVLEAAVIGKGGEIFIFDMGKPVRILDLAKQMIRLSGLELGKDIDIVFTGLREGEKLFEELLNDSENTVPTHHAKILKAKVAQCQHDQICNYLDVLEELVKDRNELKVVAMMKDIVPEYKSNYSRFEVLDE